MRFIQIKFLTILTALFYSSPSFAHIGHVGELAGHSHWVALGAALAAGLIGSLIIKSGKSEKNKEEIDADDEEETSAEEPASNIA